MAYFAVYPRATVEGQGIFSEEINHAASTMEIAIKVLSFLH